MLPLLTCLLLQVPAKPYIPCTIELKGSITQTKAAAENVRRTEDYSGKLHGFMVETQYGKNAVVFTFVPDPKQKNLLEFRGCTFGKAEDGSVKVFLAKRSMEVKNFTFSSKYRNWPLVPSGAEVSLAGEEWSLPTCPNPGDKLPAGTFTGYQSRLFFDLPDDDDQKPAPALKMELTGLWNLQNAVGPFSCRGTIAYKHEKNGINYSGSVDLLFNLDPSGRVSTF